jgi:hypothetical protein
MAAPGDAAVYVEGCGQEMQDAQLEVDRARRDTDCQNVVVTVTVPHPGVMTKNNTRERRDG